MNNVKVYNIKKLIEGQIPDKRVYRDEKLAIIVGEYGILVFDNEGIGCKRHTTNATIEIGLTDIPEPNRIFVFPRYMIDVQIKDLLTAEFEEMPIDTFIERHDYNSRLRSNFSGILDGIDEIGLNKDDYYQFKD